MKCTQCEWFKNDICTKADSYLSQIDDIHCLLRLLIVQLRDLLEEYREDSFD